MTRTETYWLESAVPPIENKIVDLTAAIEVLELAAGPQRWGRVYLQWARQLRGRPTALLVLIAIAARADRGGRCWPSLKQLAADLGGMHPNRVSEAVKALLNLGIIERTRRPRKSSFYTLVPPKPGESPDSPTTGADDSPSTRVSNIPSNIPNYKKRTYARNDEKEDDVDPSDVLVAAVHSVTGGSLVAAQKEAHSVLRQVGFENETALVKALRDPKTATMQRPLGFAIRAVQRHGGVLVAHDRKREIRAEAWESEVQREGIVELLRRHRLEREAAPFQREDELVEDNLLKAGF